MPRIAAISIVKHINDRNTHVAILALGVLDICVKNCGYPFHLQISRKEFLNELVKRFPEKPPIQYTRVQTLILQQLQEWWETICCTSKYKEDLGYIRDMHRLLTHKGYVFPEISLSDAAVLNPTERFQSAKEMEEEEREAQEAKLQELIRRGTPADLQEANRLMKIITGSRETTDYRAKVAEEIDKLRTKADLLEEMLSNVKEGESLSEDDVYTDIVATLKTSQPKIEKMVDEDHDDEEAVIKLLALNDRIQALLQKYMLIKKKDFAGAAKISSSKAATSLIDFGDDDVSAPPASAPAGTSSSTPSGGINLIDQLNGLSFSSPSAPVSQPSVNLFSNNPVSVTTTQPASTNLLQSLGSPNLLSSNTIPSTSTGGSQPDYSALKSLSPPAVSSPTPDSDWTFGTAPVHLPSLGANSNSKVVEALNDTLKLNFTITKPNSSEHHIKASFTTDSYFFTYLNLQLAVPKGFRLQMQPQSGTVVAPNGGEVTQITNVQGVGHFKLRWKVNALLKGVKYEKDGVVDNVDF